jgi:prepilin-type N-terminal cleavage/methylation domain-containing protein
MFKFLRKITGDRSGFTLTEVMIGIMILTAAIVSTSNLLVTLINTNKNNVRTLQAYYLAQEGIEAMRNIRDTNWLHNLDFKGEGGVYKELAPGGTYALYLRSEGWRSSTNEEDLEKSGIASKRPWEFSKVGAVDGVPYDNADFALVKYADGSNHYYTHGAVEDAEFFRHIDILPKCDVVDEFTKEDCENFVLVRSVVSWDDDKEVVLEEVLSNWKGGAL